MIDGVKIIEDKNSIIHFRYKNLDFYNTKSDFEKIKKEDLELRCEKITRFKEEIDEIKKKLPPPTNNDLALFERWQSESGYDE